MSLMQFSVIVTFLLPFHNVICDSKTDRELQVILNPNCDIPACDFHQGSSWNYFNNLVYVRADGTNDTIHYLWSSVGSFSILTAQTDPDSELIVNWDKFLSDDMTGSISFSKSPSYSTVTVFTNIWEYDDVDDKNNISLVTNDSIIQHRFNDLFWDNATLSDHSEAEAPASFQAYSDVLGNKTVKLNFTAFGNDGHAKKLPHLLHTSQSFQLEFMLDHVNTNFTKTRFVLELIIYGNNTSDTYALKRHHSIDDEYTPGVFTTVQLTSSLSQSHSQGSYLQWKPVCYKNSTVRTTETSSEVNQVVGTLSVSDRYEEITKSLAVAYFGSNVNTTVFTSVNISYGLQGDKFYQDTSYLSWTVSMGLGVPPSEKFSTLVIVVIIVGFGVPALLIVIGGIYILIRKRRSKDDDQNMSNEKLVNDEES